MNYELPDPERASKNIETFLSENPGHAERLNACLPQVSLLFSCSQFLANYCINNPQSLFDALSRLRDALDTQSLREELREILNACASVEDGMKAVRKFKKEKLLVITLKDILKCGGLQEIMLDLSSLADAILSESLPFMENFLSQKYGDLPDNSITVISLGKLGAQELNYSSDVDIIFAYKSEGETSGVSTVQGVTRNRISAFEYYSKLIEEYSRFLSANTEDGFGYRVDLRLRPQGQRGGLALTIRGYEEYYESWGQLWERAALLRARPAAGDMKLGKEFLAIVKPFVYRKYLDFQAIDEIRRMKSQVEQIKTSTQSKDLKRGFGGIREIEFFIQIFQLIYGGKETILRERGTLTALHRLLQKGLIGYEDLRHLSENYIFLRTLEHRLQQVNDIQTHALPSSDRELEILGRKMGFADSAGFLPELDSRRRKVRAIYDSLLFVGSGDAGMRKSGETGESTGERRYLHILSGEFWDMESPVEHLIEKELSRANVKNMQRAMRHLIKIRNTLYSFQTIKGRKLLEDTLPVFIDGALRGADPDVALLNLVDFSAIMAAKESFLEAISSRHEIISSLNFIFSHSEYLSKIIMSNPVYIEFLVEGDARKKTFQRLCSELKLLVDSHGESTAVRLFRRLEEIRLGALFLNGKIGAVELTDALTKVAEAVMFRLLRGQDSSLSVFGFGKLGGREITFNSDLDIIFVTLDEPAGTDIKSAEKILKASMLYTKDGVAYKIDTRLRPEGSKGPLVSSLKGIKDYYLKHAHGWELQALLKARALGYQGANSQASRARLFTGVKKEILTERGRELTLADMRSMRERIQKELSRDRGELPADRNSGTLSAGRHTSLPFDVKLGAGGLEELEFMVQYLQLKNCRKYPQLLVQGTPHAIRRLYKTGILSRDDAKTLEEIYVFYRNIETILRLRNESVLKEDSNTIKSMTDIIGMDAEMFFNYIREKRELISCFWDKDVFKEHPVI